MKNRKKVKKLIKLGTFVSGVILSLVFMRWWQGQCCPTPSYYGLLHSKMTLSDWLLYFSESQVYWVDGALIAVGILILFIILSFVFGKVFPLEKKKRIRINPSVDIEQANLNVSMDIKFKDADSIDISNDIKLF